MENIQKHKRRNLLKALATASIAIPTANLFATSTVKNEKASFSSEMMDFIKSNKLTQIESVKKFTIKDGDLPWTENLMSIKKGQDVSFFLDGKWWFSKEANLWVEPGLAFNVRINKGKVINTGSNTFTMTANDTGKIEVARALSEFADEYGTISTPLKAYKQSKGIIDGVVIVWKNSALEGLLELSSMGDVSNVIHTELQRIRYLPKVPDGWHNLFLFGASGVFEEKEKNIITCTSHKNVGILQKNVDINLTEDLKIDWKWLIENIPSNLDESDLHTHDYLSIAVKFDDGQDLTYIWSSGLEHETFFRCPIPGWHLIETHLVQRTGKAKLGEWLDESRNVTADYKKTINGNAKKVIQVWLIANTVFQRGYGKCHFTDITLSNKNKNVKVL